MTYLRICDTKQAPLPIADPAITYPYKLDNFQLWAIDAISRHENVLVTAKTGSGKTLVGEYQIAESLRAGRRVFYTTPIKSLSNQKFADLTKQFPQARVGIMTGDIKYMPDADIVIMTTEILQNLLFKQGTTTEHIGLTASLSLDRLDSVVFDECHYINNKERGKVWEQTMILLPPNVSLILLSATINRPDLFAGWIGDLRRKPISLIATSHRVVPLTHYAARIQGDEMTLTEIMATGSSGSEVYDGNAFRKWLDGKSADARKEREFRMAAAGRAQDVADAKASAAAANGSTVLALPAVAGKFHETSFIHQLNVCVRSLQVRDLLPALFFSFSRADCERYAASIAEPLIDTSDSAAVEHIFDFHLRQHREELATVQQYWTIRALLLKGIAFHHSGLLPMLKEVIEILFGKGYVKALFCTETFAVGINMPTRTVVFTDLKKHDDAGLRVVHTDEYIQMAGRAGRRGKDVRGTVIYLPQRQPLGAQEMQALMNGVSPVIQSRMSFGYDFILKSFHSGAGKWKEIIEQSYWYQQQKAAIILLEDEVVSFEKQAVAHKAAAKLEEDGPYYKYCQEREKLEAAIKATVNAEKKAAQRALEQFKNKHLSPLYDRAYKEYPRLRELTGAAEAAAQRLAAQHEALADPRVLLEDSLEFLVGAGYLAEDRETLTEKGHAATEVNEGHPILMVELYESGIFVDLTAEQCLALLGAFLIDRVDEEAATAVADPVVADGYKKLQTICESLESATASQPLADSISPQMIDLVADWLAGVSAKEICESYGIFEGNLTKLVLKASNLLEELIALATLKKDTALLNKLHDLPKNLVHGIATPDSLYLRL
jgi:superfamily II RNA helicase